MRGEGTANSSWAPLAGFTKPLARRAGLRRSLMRPHQQPVRRERRVDGSAPADAFFGAAVVPALLRFRRWPLPLRC